MISSELVVLNGKALIFNCFFSIQHLMFGSQQLTNTSLNSNFSSFGTFGFWTAYLKESGDVTLATGFSLTPDFMEKMIRYVFPEWTFISDPCFQREKDGNLTTVNGCV